jgi:nucleoside-diphosphate-sugar epimerase
MKKNILVTGATGFIGKHLVIRLQRDGYNVYQFPDDLDITKHKLNFEGIDHVFHLAAKTFVPLSWTQTFDFYNVNVMGTLNVLEFCRQKSCSMTFMSSYVYGNPERIPIDESHPLKPNTPYNHGKILAEELCRFYVDQFHLQITVLRPFNIYGPYQEEPFLVPILINQLLDQSKQIIEVMDLKPKRDFLYIDDLIDAMMLTIENDKFSIYNIGGGHSVSVEEIIITLLNISGLKKNYRSKCINREGEIMDIVADISMIEKELRWKPVVSLEYGLKKTIMNMSKKGNDHAKN